MSSCVLSSRTNINKTSQEEIINEPEDLLNQGIENIYHSFNMNNKIYKDKINENENIINGLTKKLEMLNNEMEMLQRENQYYKSQNEKLKKEVEKLNKIVKNIQGRLSSVDFQINECIKGDTKCLNLKKNNDSNKKLKNNSFQINYKNKDNEQSLFHLKSKNYLITDKENNGNYNNKSTKNKRLVYYIDNNILKDNGNKINYDKDLYKDNNNKKINYETFEDIKKKFNKTAGYNSFDVNVKINNYNNNMYKNNAKLKTPNSVLYKNVITKEDKKKRNNNNKEMESELPKDTSFSCQDNVKNRSYSSKQFLKEKEKEKNNNSNNSNNKTTDDKENNNLINNEDLNIDSNNINKGFEEKICLTYDNKFNKNAKKKNSYNSFRGKILNISENIFKNDNKKDKYNNNFVEKKTKNDEITFFLRKCKILLDKESFEEIMKLFQEYKEGLLTDEGIITKTQIYLENNEELIELFNNVFGK